ncbi:HyaD/HybD family hydrogenase maturation endopeptidase [uncultured Thiodictyon sp.]|uniref:HyaD/HybD family hydrogenase maturation endopeptidase n=1 Tax=uncultured Thiodictyon sp. TaxID=1846217 RepID=UPI0025EAE3A7|nr:HyaD/HybD family hydrogenase maturation endopeptidase [uncultured Thiodictyon sp.]
MSAASDWAGSPSPSGILLLGLGNLLLSDEGLGVHCLRRLETGYRFEPPIALIDGGTAGVELLQLFRDHQRIVVIDALDGGQPPGTVSVIRDEAIRRALEVKLTLHHLGLAEVLALLDLLDERPAELVLIGVAPQRLELDLELSPGVAAAIPAVITTVEAVLTGWGVQVRTRPPDSAGYAECY